MNNEITAWWISNSGKLEGPVDQDEVRRRIRERMLSPDAYACLAGTEDWRRLSEILQFLQEFGDAPPPPPPPDAGPAHPPPYEAAKRYGWNPLAIAFLGLLFTPIWSGIMAAINGRRLGLDQPIWRPLAIGIGSQIICITIACAGFETGFFWGELIFTIAPLLALWSLDLDPQHAEYERQADPPLNNWLIPALAGSPLALLTILGLGVELFAPLEPAVVVQRFVDASNVAEARPYCTSNMDDLLDGIAALEKLAGSEAAVEEPEIELLSEYYDEYSDNDYGVDFRMEFPPMDDDPALTLHGYFHLKWTDDRWKIDDWIVTASSEFPDGIEPASFLVIVEAALEEARRNPPVEPEKTTFGRLWEMFCEHPRYSFFLVIFFAALARAFTK